MKEIEPQIEKVVIVVTKERSKGQFIGKSDSQRRESEKLTAEMICSS